MPKTPKGGKSISKDINLVKPVDSKEIKKVKRAPVAANVQVNKNTATKIVPNKT
jgi:hypothetical protein